MKQIYPKLHFLEVNAKDCIVPQLRQWLKTSALSHNSSPVQDSPNVSGVGKDKFESFG